MNRYGSRKFLISLVVILSANALVLVQSITPAIWGSVVGSVIMTYVAGNVIQKSTAKDTAQ